MYLHRPCEDDLGIATELRTFKISKDATNRIGITVGGGADCNCPCLYVDSINEAGPVGESGCLLSGDEILAVNGLCVKGCTIIKLTHLIQSLDSAEIEMTCRRLIIDHRTFFKKDFDLTLKKIKHRFIEQFGENVANLLGLSRAILINDPLVSRLANLDRIGQFYTQTIQLFQKYVSASQKLVEVHRSFGDSLAGMGARDPQKSASSAFTVFGNAHRSIAKLETLLNAELVEFIKQMETFCVVVMSDLRMTVAKYADTKFEYLSYSLKLRELQEEEKCFQKYGEVMVRTETGNYGYRAILHMRDIARQKFASSRKDVNEKLELADKKHLDGFRNNIKELAQTMVEVYKDCDAAIGECAKLFPIEPEILSSSVKDD